MSFAQRISKTVTTDASGDATAYTENIRGRLSQIRYVKNDYAAGVDFTITNDATGETIWTESNVNASKTIAPRQATHDTAGVASLYAAGGEPVEAQILLGNDRIKIVIAQGGDTKNGTFHFIFD